MGDSALQELQQRLMQHSSLLKSVGQQMRVVQTTAKRSRLTLDELLQIPDGTPCFDAVGRAYFSAPKPQIQTNLQEVEEQCLKQVAELTKTREKITKDVHTVETEIRELLQSDPALGKRFLNQ